MVLSGPPTPGGGVQSVPASLMRSNSGILGAQGGSAVQSQPAFPSLLSPRGQYNNMSLLSNISNVSSLLNQSFGSGGSNAGISGSGGGLQCGGMDIGGAESDSRSSVSSGMSFTPSATAFVPSNAGNPSSSVQPQGQQFSKSFSSQLAPDQQQQPQQVDAQSFQHGQQSLQQFPAPHNQPQQQQSHQQYQSLRGGLSNLATVKLEPQTGNEQNGPQQQLQQPMQSLRSLGSVKMEAPHIQSLRSLGQVKMESQHSEQSLYSQHQQQQLMHMSRQTSPVAAAQMTLLQQQRLLQLQQQQQQQQQILKAIPQQRSQLQQQNIPLRLDVKPGVYEPGMCARRLTSYMYAQQHRPADNNIEFWRKFVAGYFAPNARKRWCVSLYGSGRQTTGVFPQDVWHCEICNCKPGRGFETTVEVLPRLFKVKYDSGTLEELLYVDMPQEYQNASGQIVLDYAKAIQESVFEQLHVVRDGQLRIVFTSDLKICSWEFCARRHEELIPRRSITPQFTQLGAVAQKYQAANASSDLPSQELQNTCDMFVVSARQLAKALEVPLVNDLGYTKRYIRCLQISEVVNSMKDLIDYSRQTGTGPMASLIKFPRRTATSSGHHSQGQQPDDHRMVQNSNNDQNSLAASNNGVVNVNNSLNAASTSSSGGTVVGLLHQNSMNSRQENTVINANGLFGSGNSVQIPSASSSSALTQPNPPSPFQSPTASTSNNPPQTSHNAFLSSSSIQMNSANSPANVSVHQTPQSNEADPSDSHSSVQKIIQEMMMSGGSMVGMGSLGSEIKNINGIGQTGKTTLNGGGAGLAGNGMTNTSGISGAGFSNMVGLSPSSASGIRGAMTNNLVALNGRVNMSSLAQDTSMNSQQQDLGTRLLSGLGAVNNLNNLQFDWKSSP